VDSGAYKNFQSKSNSSPVTIADLRIQRTIEYNLNALYPGLQVRGEEDPKQYSKYEPAIRPEEIKRGGEGVR
jgi:3'-phosphoadenosine 5'-phosphosulfate (PAPS) 3'-phosphatase